MGLGLRGLKHKEEKNERVCDPKRGSPGGQGAEKSTFPDPEVSAICWAFLNISQMGSFAIPGHNILPSGKHSPCPSRCGLTGTAAAPEVEPPEFMGEALLPWRTERRTVRRRIKFSNRRRSAESWSIRCSCCLNSSLVGPFWLEEDPRELLPRGLLLRPREVLERLVDRGDRRAPLLEREVLGAGLQGRDSPRRRARTSWRSARGSVKIAPGTRPRKRA